MVGPAVRRRQRVPRRLRMVRRVRRPRVRHLGRGCAGELPGDAERTWIWSVRPSANTNGHSSGHRGVQRHAIDEPMMPDHQAHHHAGGARLEARARRSRPPAAVALLVVSTFASTQSPPASIPAITAPAGSAAIEQTSPGARAPATLVTSFDGLGGGFVGPQGTAMLRNPSDNSLAVGPNHIVQTVNSRMAIFTKRGKQFEATGKVLYGPVPTNNVFRGFGPQCETRNNGDAVVRYDQIADRWLIVMPIFSRLPPRDTEPAPGHSGEPARQSMPGRGGQPGDAVRL